jgi:hypothetical protein
MREDERARWTKLVADFESADLSQREFALNCSTLARGTRRRISAAMRGTFAVPPVQHTTPISPGSTPAAFT